MEVTTTVISRKLTMKDILPDKNYSENTHKYDVSKNQKEFGEKKRIKP